MTPLRKHTLQKHFDKIRSSNCTIFIAKDNRNDNLEKALALGTDALAKQYKLTQIAASRFARVFSFSAPPKNPALYYKEYLHRSGWDFAKHLLRPARAARAARAHQILLQNHLDAPKVIAFGTRRTAFLNSKSFLLTANVENAKNIFLHIPTRPEDFTKPAVTQKRNLIKAFSRTVGNMHAAGIFHGDLRLGNVLAKYDQSSSTPDAGAPTWQFFFLDNERTRKFRRLPKRLRLKNLVQINMYLNPFLTSTDRARFFTEYLKANPSIAKNKKTWARRAIAKTHRRLNKKNAKLNAP